MTVKDITDFHIALQLFPGYTEADLSILAEFANPDAKAEPGFIVDFLGSRIRTTSVWKEARALDGQIVGLPTPGDFHAEAVEWIGLLKAVRSARGQYVAMELGAGFGPWIIAGGLAARRKGIDNIRLWAVEGDPHHFQFLRQHFSDNGFNPDRHNLLNAAVGVNAGVAEWAVMEESVAAETWGCRPIQEDTDSLGRQFQNTQRVDVIPLRDLVAKESIWDLIHIDVQGDEVDICRSCIDELNTRVRWLIVGTHSRKIDGDLLELMCRAGWILEHEKPTKFTFSPSPSTLEAMTTVDGTQVWRNPRIMNIRESLASFSQEITSATREFRVEVGGIYTLNVVAKNTGVEPWTAGKGGEGSIDASYRWLDSRGTVLPIEGHRARLSRPVIQPGETDCLQLFVAAPPVPGVYKLWVSMVQEGVDWFYCRGTNPLAIDVKVE